MMYMHYCPGCGRIHMLNGHKQTCPRCENSLAELKIDYAAYSSMNETERTAFLAECADPDRLNQLKTTYRMYKYSKRYRELRAENKNSDTSHNEQRANNL